MSRTLPGGAGDERGGVTAQNLVCSGTSVGVHFECVCLEGRRQGWVMTQENKQGQITGRRYHYGELGGAILHTRREMGAIKGGRGVVT